jgi:putative intracellular protease/amidase
VAAGQRESGGNQDVIKFVAARCRRQIYLPNLLCCRARAGGNDLLKGRRYVCSGDLWQDVKNGEYVDAPVVEDGNLISGKGFGHVLILPLPCGTSVGR